MQSIVPTLPESAPFTPDQRAWLNGYLAGLFYDRNQASVGTGGTEGQTLLNDAPAESKGTLWIGWGSQTGTAAGIARTLAREGGRRGFDVQTAGLEAWSPSDLVAKGRIIIVTSTWGDGDPPENAVAFVEGLNDPGMGRLEGVEFAVLGLGDRNYSEFCGAAQKLASRLEALGARRIQSIGLCDVEYEAAVAEWSEALWATLDKAPLEGKATQRMPMPIAPTQGGPQIETRGEQSTADVAQTKLPAIGTRAVPCPAVMTGRRMLNGPGSSKDTRHLEIAWEASEVTYEAGDALGIQPENDPDLVAAILAAAGLSPNAVVTSPKTNESTSVELVLLHDCSLNILPRALLADVANESRSVELQRLLAPGNGAALNEWLVGRDVLDVIQEFGADWKSGRWIPHLRPLTPRLYSIASSPKAVLQGAHLTVGVVSYEMFGRRRHGVCSGWLAKRVVPGSTSVSIFIQKSPKFRLPKDSSVPIIMVGPGTGIAPFRAFLQEREATGATGGNWLCFGDQHQSTDFLYSDEIQAWQRSGHLKRLDLAFSRDQAEKVYVQNRMLENAAEMWRWLQKGAHFYVCGDATRMAKDVDAALHQVAETAGALSADGAKEYIETLRSTGRYQRDVY